MKKVEVSLPDFVVKYYEEKHGISIDDIDLRIDCRIEERIRREKQARERPYSLYTSGPIDHWEDFIHLKEVSEKTLKHISNNPKVEYTYHDIWEKILSKLQWAWILCPSVDKDLRDSDVYVNLKLWINVFEADILFKSDNNGEVNLVVDESFDERERVNKVNHENGCEWVKVFPI